MANRDQYIIDLDGDVESTVYDSKIAKILAIDLQSLYKINPLNMLIEEKSSLSEIRTFSRDLDLDFAMLACSSISCHHLNLNTLGFKTFDQTIAKKLEIATPPFVKGTFEHFKIDSKDEK